MDKFTDIAADYLRDIGVLSEARKELEKTLEQWWKVLVQEKVKSALNNENSCETSIVENQKESYMECRVVANQPMSVKLMDPRTSERPFYTVSLWIGSEPARKKLVANCALQKQIDDIAKTEAEWVGALNWNRTELANRDIEILPDDPEKTSKQLCVAVVAFFRVVMAHHRATKHETPA